MPDQSCLLQGRRIDWNSIWQLAQIAEVYDLDFFPPDVRETTLWKATVNGHLAALEAALVDRAAASQIAFFAPSGTSAESRA
jgi:hypothetical protein